MLIFEPLCCPNLRFEHTQYTESAQTEYKHNKSTLTVPGLSTKTIQLRSMYSNFEWPKITMWNDGHHARQTDTILPMEFCNQKAEIKTSNVSRVYECIHW